MIFNLNKNKRMVMGVVAPVVIASVVYFFTSGNSFEISKNRDKDNLIYEPHPLTGQKCENYNKRPFAVMLAADPVARPLASISMADVVVEMPVVKDSINRLMALYVCSEPEEIGSVRSARHDFIPLAAGFDAIYAHWGGSSFALKDLDKGIIDNIDALINPNEAFYRKQGIPMPHDGFTSYERLKKTTEYLGYRLENNFEGYKYIDGQSRKEDGATTLVINYPYPHSVSYIYNKDTNTYLRWRGGSPELDKLTGNQVRTNVIVVIKTTSRRLNADYNDVDITGSGEALVFQNGEVVPARWEKEEALSAKLKFVNEGGEEITFVRGKMWLNYIDYGTQVIWGEKKL
ncbi:MAG: hypothetical protein A3E58_01690 [Candidatus Spechtbacteria bacterium RIFCSPHIGHO2_12_FULL_38_30]|nr:MAG: hypothetical protein A3E58_01690 [Candidatus Spechtbacteria bacterium RIFCSPHIGHO2_12_FULL_38_30]